ncbi:endonuclease MutS2 [Gudongella sp. DL1XJH-153]|uniref:endonuclease MutS2 n=1 Tax=Gudongella sp. DL1XJH-153 TaxID=3409804 RepID=UPI003BB67CB4
MNHKSLNVLEFYKIREMLIEKAESTPGKSIAKDLMPSTDSNEVKFSQSETQEALTLLMKRGNPPLFGIYKVRDDVKRAELGGMLHPGALLRIGEGLRVSRALKNYMRDTREETVENYKIIGDMIQNLGVFKDLENSISNAIISEDEISDNASTTLRNIRRQIRGKNDGIKDKLNSIINSSTHRKFLQDAIVTMREGRYVIPVKQENRGSVPGLVHDVSSSGATAFIEPMAVVELNNQLKELEIKEREEIERILMELTGMVGEDAEGIRSNELLLSRLDFVFAKGKLALTMNATKPVFNENGYLNIKKGRHPLLGKDVVPIDVYLGDQFNTLIITGPNTGGKTVTLKTVGLFTLMGQSGLHIPADFNSELSLFKKVFADIGDEQSIEQSLSTFSSHMTNIVDILDEVNESSLVLFDELGAGTDPTEGAALAMSILDHLRTMGIRTLATTHYSQLKIYALTTDYVRNASVEFDVETLSPTYKLLIGVPGKSNAFEISKRLGLQDYIVDRARELLTKENIEFEDVLQAMDRDRKIAEENKTEAERLKLDIQKLREQLQNEKGKTEELREKILQRAKEEARQIVRNAKDNADLIIDELKSISSEIDRDKGRRLQEAQDMLRKEIREKEAQASTGIKEIKSKKPPMNLKAGETVEVLSLNQQGTVVTPPDDKGNVEVQIGIMKVNVSLSTLRRAEGNEQTTSMEKSKSVNTRKTKAIKSELDLRGRNIEEGTFELDKYLDDAFISGLKEVYIIHGKGTGALRDGVKSYLKNHRLVKSQRLGKYGEGGDGVTVVELKNS